MITLVRTVQTCFACPSQWDAWDADGNYYYLRYRHGHGSVRQYSGPDWPGAGVHEEGRAVSSFEYGHPLDGDIELDEFCRLAGLGLSPGLVATGWGDHMRDEMILRGLVGPEALTGDGDARED